MLPPGRKVESQWVDFVAMDYLGGPLNEKFGFILRRFGLKPSFYKTFVTEVLSATQLVIARRLFLSCTMTLTQPPQS
jgi:hypothetical protein